MSKRPLVFDIDRVGVVAVVLDAVKNKICKGLESGPVTVTIGRPSKSRLQEAKYHCFISDIAKTHKRDNYHRDVKLWKAVCVDAFELEMKLGGEKIHAPGRMCFSLDGKRMLTERASTKDFWVSEASKFIEFLYALGTDLDVTWSEKSTDIYNEYREASK